MVLADGPQDPHTWSLTGSLISGRGQHTATLLSNGQVLVAGGGFGGDQGETPYASAELYAPRVHRWIATGSMHVRRAGHTATLLPTGQVLVTGGWSGWMMDPRQPSAELIVKVRKPEASFMQKACKEMAFHQQVSV
jgi:hypothetical protein